MIVLYIILAVLVLLLAVVLLRTAAFRPKAEAFRTYAPVEFDREAAVTNLQRLIRCRTVSYTDASKEDPAEFEKLIALLPELYPHVYEKCTLTRLPDRGLLFYWAGKAHDEASVMMAHFDVVPVEEENWKKPPFEGIIEDGVLWGRGTLDTKVTFNGVLTAADHLIAARLPAGAGHLLCLLRSGGDQRPRRRQYRPLVPGAQYQYPACRG